MLIGKVVDSLANNFTVNLFFRFRLEKANIAAYQRDEQEKNYQSERYIVLMLVFLSIVFLIGGILLNGFMVFYWMHGKISTGEIIQIFNTAWNVAYVIWVSGEMIPHTSTFYHA